MSGAGPLAGLRIRDTFAGGVAGWDHAVRDLGGNAEGWELLDIARQTREAIGLTTVGADVQDAIAWPGQYDMELSSPPCPGFSIAGHGKGRMDLDLVRAGIRRLRQGWPGEKVREYVQVYAADPRTHLTLEPLRLVHEGLPTFTAWEQVPTVLPLWESCAEFLRDVGYDVWTGIVHAEEYGVPQVRKRAVLMARRDGLHVQAPRATHQRYGQPLTDRLIRPCVTMATALGWGMTARPSMTVSAGGTGSGGGLEVFGNGARRGMRAEMDRGLWLDDGVQRWSASGKSIRVSTQDALTLQGFDRTLPVQGLIGQRSMQVGNAFPPPVARAVLLAVTAGAAPLHPGEDARAAGGQGRS